MRWSRFRTGRRYWLGICIAFASIATAQTPPIPIGADDSLAPIPATGLWWEHGRNGQFWSIEVGPGGYGFVQFSTFDENRQPIFLVMQGPLEAASVDDTAAGAVYRLRSPLYQLDQGACLGCEFRPAKVRPSRFGEAELVFHSTTEGEFRWHDQRISINRFPLFDRTDDALESRLSGNYMMTWHGPHGERKALLARVEQTPLSPAGWSVVAYDQVAGDQFGGAPSSSLNIDLSNYLIGLELTVDAGTDQLRAAYRTSDGIRGCLRVCPCATAQTLAAIIGQQSNNRCMPDDFSTRQRHPLSASGEVEGSLILAAPASAASPQVEDLGVISLRRIEPEPIPQRSAPNRGLWWETGRNGRFWSIDIGAGGYMFVNLGSFDEQGQPIFLTMQGQFEASAASATGGVIGRLRSPLYRLSGGQCLGCSFAPAMVGLSEYGSAEIEFYTTERAAFLWNGERIAIEKFPLYVRPLDLPAQRIAGGYMVAIPQGGAQFGATPFVLQSAPASCAVAAGASVLKLECTSPFCHAPFSPLPAVVDLEALEFHVTDAPFQDVAVFQVDADGCSPYARVDTREGRLELLPLGDSLNAPLVLLPIIGASR